MVRVHLSEYKDETSEVCHWHVPAAHYLESWGDTRCYDGTVTIMQPLIEPLYGGKTMHELLAVFSDKYDRRPYDIVKSYWQTNRLRLGTTQGQAAGAGAATQGQAPAQGSTTNTQSALGPAAAPAPSPSPSQDFELWWRKAVHDGFIPNSAPPAQTISSQGPSEQYENLILSKGSGGFEIVFRTDPLSIYDGRFANNGWLQELPKPLTKVTWDNVAVVSLNSARQLAGNTPVRHGSKGREHYVRTVDLVSQQGRVDRVPLWILPGQPDGVITVHLGYGRRLAGDVGSPKDGPPVGFDVYQIRTSYEPWFSNSIQVNPNKRGLLARHNADALQPGGSKLQS